MSPAKNTIGRLQGPVTWKVTQDLSLPQRRPLCIVERLGRGKKKARALGEGGGVWWVIAIFTGASAERHLTVTVWLWNKEFLTQMNNVRPVNVNPRRYDLCSLPLTVISRALLHFGFFKCPKSFQWQDHDLWPWNSDHYVETEIDSHPGQGVNEKNCYLASFDEVPFETMYDTETNKRRTVCSCFRIEKVWSRRVIIALF